MSSSNLNFGGALAFAGFLLYMLAPQEVAADEHDWYQYESTYFVANSDASKRRTLSILKELELFRAAASQAANLRVPESAPKTELLIIGNDAAFRKLAMGSNVGGFVTRYDDRFLIVIPASGDADWDYSVVRHEYSHVLLGYSNYRFPQWYNEGFAELMSTIDFRARNTTFSFGEAPRRVKMTSFSGWNTLISEGFDRSHHAKVSAAYLKSWVLTHYLMLGDDFANTPKLYEYLQRYNAGEPSLSAFEKAFGMDGNELAHRKLKIYVKRMPYVVYNFRPDTMDTDFQRSSSDIEAVESLLDALRARASKD